MSAATETQTKLAIQGGPKAVTADPGKLFTWPIVTREDEEAVLDVLRRGAMSGMDVTEKYEAEMAAWHGVEFALAHNNGTAALHTAMYACGVRQGTEIIGPSMTYWASVMPALSLGAAIVFADVDAYSLNIDPKDIEHRITPRTRAIVAVHYGGFPCDMDAIMAIARKHNLKVIEDVSHAQGTRYKGRICGTIGDVGAMSLMAGKSLVSGEGGMLITNQRPIYEHAAAFGHYERTGGPSRFAKSRPHITDPELLKFSGLPLGGVKYRMHQMSSAVGRVQLKHYPERMAEIQRAMNRFFDLLEGVPGIGVRRTKDEGSTMGGWYYPIAHYKPEELHGLPVGKFCEALAHEGVPCGPGANAPLNVHALIAEADIYGEGKPTNVANAGRDLKQGRGTMPVSEAVPARCLSVPWFKHDRKEAIETYAAAIRKVALAAQAGILK